MYGRLHFTLLSEYIPLFAKRIQAVDMQGLDDPFAQFAFQAPAAKRYRMTRGGFTR